MIDDDKKTLDGQAKLQQDSNPFSKRLAEIRKHTRHEDHETDDEEDEVENHQSKQPTVVASRTQSQLRGNGRNNPENSENPAGFDKEKLARIASLKKNATIEKPQDTSSDWDEEESHNDAKQNVSELQSPVASQKLPDKLSEARKAELGVLLGSIKLKKTLDAAGNAEVVGTVTPEKMKGVAEAVAEANIAEMKGSEIPQAPDLEDLFPSSPPLVIEVSDIALEQNKENKERADVLEHLDLDAEIKEHAEAKPDTMDQDIKVWIELTQALSEAKETREKLHQRLRKQIDAKLTGDLPVMRSIRDELRVAHQRYEELDVQMQAALRHLQKEPQAPVAQDREKNVQETKGVFTRILNTIVDLWQRLSKFITSIVSVNEVDPATKYREPSSLTDKVNSNDSLDHDPKLSQGQKQAQPAAVLRDPKPVTFSNKHNGQGDGLPVGSETPRADSDKINRP